MVKKLIRPTFDTDAIMGCQYCGLILPSLMIKKEGNSERKGTNQNGPFHHRPVAI